ncbi:MAG: beta-ketoacyl synthase N-terminal-like domain-containing protein [Polyangiaceae bacterium]|jgi:3-oxoacyl-(acyl-carrier-protein) synthase
MDRAITGCGVVSALGTGRSAFFTALASGARATSDDGRVETFDASKYAGALVAEVRGFDAAKHLGDKGLRTLDRLSKLLIVATRLTLDDAALKTQGRWIANDEGDPPWPERVGLVVSNAYGSLEAITELDRVALLEDARYINPSRFPLTVSNSAAGYASIWEDLRALNVTVSDGNCGALDAVACGDLLLENARADVLLVGGAEALTEALFVGFRRLGMDLHAGVVDGSSNGACLGEGAALVAIETAEGARRRGVESLAEIRGYGTSFAPPERAGSLVHATSDALERAIVDAIADASIGRDQVDLIVSGVSGLRAFDEAELTAIRRVMGPDALIVAPKLAFGETLGASGAMAIAATLGYLRDVPIRCLAPGVRPNVRGPLRTAVVTSIGFYGNASALVMHRASR